jgi:hypothetical protein
MSQISNAIIGFREHIQQLATPLPRPAGLIFPEEQPAKCATCADTRWVRRESDIENRPGYTEPCPRCAAARLMAHYLEAWPVEEAEFHRMARQPMLSLRLPSMELSEEARAALQTLMRDWCYRIVALDGGYGVGKTHMLARAWFFAQQLGKTVIYTTATAMEERINPYRNGATTSSSQDSEAQREAQRNAMRIQGAAMDLATVDLLLIDEADDYTRRGDESGWFERQFFEIVNRRVMARRPTVLAGNQLGEKLHPKIISRAMSESSRWIKLHDAPDMRPYEQTLMEMAR